MKLESLNPMLTLPLYDLKLLSSSPINRPIPTYKRVLGGYLRQSEPLMCQALVQGGLIKRVDDLFRILTRSMTVFND